MRTLCLGAGAGALLGGLVGVSGTWVVLGGGGAAASAAASDAQRATFDAALLARLTNLERSMRALEGRRDVTGPSVHVAQSVAGPAAGEPRSDEARSEAGRGSQRGKRPSEQAQELGAHWATELTMRLGLSPAQTAKISDIYARLTDELAAGNARSVQTRAAPREQQATQAVRSRGASVRRRADRELREVLDPRQLAEYARLADLELFRP